MSDRRIRAVLLNWNEADQTERCLDALLDSRGVKVDVVVVDNGSHGSDATRFRDRLGPERVIALPDNRGYVGGMNAGLEFWRCEASSDPVLLITPDAIVQQPTLAELRDELDTTPDCGVVGPIVMHNRESPAWMTAGGAVRPRALATEPHKTPRSDRPYDVEWIDGCCMLIRPELLDSVRGFDERYFIYYEEVDFCGRARADGWRVRVVPRTTIDHPKALGSQRPYYFYYMVRNRYLFWRENHDVGALRVAVAVLIATARSWGALVRSVIVPSRRHEQRLRLRDARLQLRAAVVGTRDHLLGRHGRMAPAVMPQARE